jgi:hypothetical protein
VATVRPSGENATDCTPPARTVKRAVSRPVAASQKRSEPPSRPARHNSTPAGSFFAEPELVLDATRHLILTEGTKVTG